MLIVINNRLLIFDVKLNVSDHLQNLNRIRVRNFRTKQQLLQQANDESITLDEHPREQQTEEEILHPVLHVKKRRLEEEVLDVHTRRS